MNDCEGQANETKVVRKIDVHLISALFLLFIFNILDRSNIANARLGGMQEDLALTDTQYQTAVAIMVILSKYQAKHDIKAAKSSLTGSLSVTYWVKSLATSF